MKKSLTLIFSLLLIFCFKAQARQLTVGAHGDFQKITAAISNSKNGDTILVNPGIYKEGNIIITKKLHLIGKGYPIIDGESKGEIISIKADSVTFEGFTIQHSGYASLQDPAGIKIYDSKYVQIVNNIVNDTFFGIYAQYAIGCIIKNNRLTSHGKLEQEIGNGIHCWKSDSMQITGNTISGHRDGIYFEFVTNSLIWLNNSCKNIRYGLHFMFSHNDSYIGNTFSNNGAGVAVMFTHGVRMYNNTFELNWGDAAYGLLLKEISDSYIQGNHFNRNTTGIYMEGASRIEMTKNIFTNNGWAMRIQASCMDVKVTHCNFRSNSFDVATNGTLVLNYFSENYWDKYEGYDLNKDNYGDVAYRPISMFSMIIETNPQSMILFRSVLISLLDRTEKVVPTLIPENLKDDKPLMKPEKL